MKKVTIINQNKGGSGKSFLAALILKKEVKAGANFILIDIDSGNRSSYKRFSETEEYAPCIDEYSLLDGDSIDKGLFNDFFESIAESSKDVFYLDLGGNESREILALFQAIGIENVSAFMDAAGLDLQFYTVVRAGDRDCIDHLANVVDVIGDKFGHTCYVNEISIANDGDFKVLEKVTKKLKVGLRRFGNSPKGVPERKLSDYVKSGFQTSLGMFHGIFVGMVDNLDLS